MRVVIITLLVIGAFEAGVIIAMFMQ